MGERGPTRVCVLTAEGRGAISVLRVWGPRAVEITDSIFRPSRGGSLESSDAERLRFGRMGTGLGDEVVAVRIEGTPEQVEVHCHGGPAARELVLSAFIEAGAEERRPVAWIRDTSQGLIQAEALVDLMQAPTVRTAEILLEQSQGCLESDLCRIAELISVDPTDAHIHLRTLLERSSVGLRLISGWRIALAGKPNVGKSRLLNRLAGFDRAIVDASPGTTRDIVTLRTAFEGWPVELSDTAGLRESGDMIEQSGIELARARHREADFVLLVLDRSNPLTEDDPMHLANLGHVLVVANKSDLTPRWDLVPGMVPVSAETGEGVDNLIRELVKRLVPISLAAGDGVPFRRSQVQALREVERLLESRDLLASASALESLAKRTTARA